MKVIKVIGTLDFGGIEKVFEITARYYEGDRADIVFLCLGKGGAAENAIRALGFRVLVWQARTRIPSVALMVRLTKFFREEKPAVVHTTGAEANFHGIIAARLSGIPVRIAEEIGMPSHSGKAKRIFRLIYGQATAVIAVAGLVRDYLVKNGEASAAKTKVVYNPVDVRAFGAPENGAPAVFRIISVCRLDPIKNLDLLVRGMHALKMLPQRTELWLVGDGPERARLEALVSELGLTDRVTFWGFQQRPASFLNQASLFVLPSFSEGIPLSVAEAMLTETPCLVTRIGGAPEFIEAGKNGWLLDPRDQEGFDRELAHIATLPEEARRDVGKRGRETALEKFHPDRYMRDLWALYRGEEKIRVLHCMETIASGGVEQLRYNLAKYIDANRFEQKIVCTHAVGVLPARFEALGVEVIPIGSLTSPFRLGQYRKVLKVIRAYKPHIVHGAVIEGITLGAVAGTWARVPGIIIEETSDPVDRNWGGNLLMRIHGRLSDKVVAVSEASGRYIRSVVKVKEPKLQVIMNAVDRPLRPDAAATEALKTALGIQPGDWVVGSVGRLFDDHKKVSDLLRATALLKTGCPGIKLLIVGDGKDAGALKALSGELGIADRVVFAGYQGDTAPYYACMDMFALASQREAFGLVLVEAMFFGLPVVATAVGGVLDVVVDGVTGLLVGKNDPAALAEAIHALYADPGRSAALGRAGLRRAESEFDIPLYIRKISQLYTDLVRKKRTGI